MTTAAPAIYGGFLYGTRLYGSTGAATGAQFNWIVEVDWDGDGVFDGSNESERMLDIDVSRGRKNWMQPTGQGFYPISVGTCRITLDNHDGMYDAWNTASPLYPNVTYGRDVRIRVVDMDTSTTYSIFYGVISDIVPSGYGANRIVQFKIEDGLRFLRDNYGSVGAQTNYPPESAISSILTSVNWQTRWGTNLDATTDSIPYFICTGVKNAADDINDICDSFLDQFFVAANGNATFRSKANITTGSNYDESILLKDIGMPQPWIYSRNITKIFTSTYGSASTATTTYNGTGYSTYPRTFKLTAPWLQSTTSADNEINIIGSFLATLHPTPIIQLVNRPAYQFPELFDIITLTIPTLGINGDSFKIGGMEHRGTPQEIFTTLYLEPYLSGANFWTWDVTNFGVTTIFGW